MRSSPSLEGAPFQLGGQACRSASAAAGLVALCLFAAACAAGREPLTPEELAAAAPKPGAPETIERVWYGQSQKFWKQKGKLELRRDALALTGRKAPVVIPLESIYTVSFGKLRGDVNTDWAVLALGQPPTLEVVGFRDGRALGWGRRTPEIHDKIREHLRAGGAAQFRVPAGARLFEAPGTQFTTVVPAEWSLAEISTVFLGERPVWGTTLASVEPLRKRVAGAEAGIDVDAVARAFAGESPAFWIERAEAPQGMGCEAAFSEAERRHLLERFAGDPRLADLGRDASAEPIEVGGCAGQRFTAEGAARPLELVVAVHGNTLLVYGTRAPAGADDPARAAFDAAISATRFLSAL